MFHRTAILSFAVFWISTLAGTLGAAEPGHDNTDPFAFDGTKNILDEAHFGIVNGKLTSGIPYRNALAVKGLWAPPFVSSDFTLGVTLMDQPITTDRYTWHPFHVERAGSIQGVAVETVTMLIPGSRAGLVAITLTNSATEQRTVPVAITVGGTLDRVEWWEFATAASQTATTRKMADGSLTLEQGAQAIVLRAGSDIRWDDLQPIGRGSISLPPSGSVKLNIVFAIGPTAEAQATCEKVAADPETAIAGARAAYAQRLRDLFQNIPQLESSNPALERFYYRSLVPLLMNRWDVPEFLLHPYYSTGSVNGGCVCSYLWDFGESWEILPLVDAEATKSHIKQFVAADMVTHFAFDPIKGTAWGPWYPVNQEKIVGLIYYYVKNTGDLAFLNDVVEGKTILEHAIANAMYGDDPTKPVALIDYGPSNSHLELRRGFPYNHVMPDLNGRRYDNYMLAAELADVAGKPATYLRQRAEELKVVLKRGLWNEKARWFDFEDGKGRKDIRYTSQMFYLFGSKVLDAEQEAGLLAHLNDEKEFLSEFGQHSISKTDVAYDQVDIDCGGGGSFTAFPTQIAEKLYNAGHPDDAENILKRILWWGDRVPYWGDSFVANQIDYRKDTPLQCTIDGSSAAQAIIFGMFGIRAEFDGNVRIDPHPPAFSPEMKLSGLRLRGHVLDIAVKGGVYEVREGEKRLSAGVGQPILVRGDQLLYGGLSN